VWELKIGFLFILVIFIYILLNYTTNYSVNRSYVCEKYWYVQVISDRSFLS